MSTNVPRSKESKQTFDIPPVLHYLTGAVLTPGSTGISRLTTSKLWRSEGHPVNRKTGKRESGGPFHVTHTGSFIRPGTWTKALGGNALERLYSGPIWGPQLHSAVPKEHYDSTVKDMDESSMSADGATAVSLVAPTNPTANLGTALAESFREGVPSLPGIQSWQHRTEKLRNVGSEYLNYQFGWAPLRNEVNSVVNAARYHRDIMQNYRHNEGRNVHRRFDFSPEIDYWSVVLPTQTPCFSPQNTTFFASGYNDPAVTRGARVTCKNVRKRWFEGCFTYGGPAKADNFGRHIGFGSEADAVFGLELSPDVLWNLTPWSWAVDWFTNAGDVIHNITNFTLAGLVMRYGYMMEETSSTYYTHYEDGKVRTLLTKSPKKTGFDWMGSCDVGQETVRKSRCPANPFGFGVGWEGLSPTQLAITAALGITRLL